MYTGRATKGLIVLTPVVMGATVIGLCLLPAECSESVSRFTVGMKDLMLRRLRLPAAIARKFRADVDAENFFP